MKKVENYRPDEIEFTAESNEVPKFLSDETFESTEDAHKYINEHFIASSSKFTGIRIMDDNEIESLRGEYREELEEILPELKELEEKAQIEFDSAKKRYNQAKDMVVASLQKIQNLSDEVREGTTDMQLDQAFTYEIVYNGKRFYYTIIDHKIQLCGIREIPLYEQADLLSSSDRNATSFREFRKVVNEQ